MILGTNLYAVIPSCCRLIELHELVERLDADGVHCFVIDTGYVDLELRLATVITPGFPQRNISKWWNIGLDAIAASRLNDDEYTVAVLNDDLRVPRDFVRILDGALQFHGATLAYPDVYGLGRDHVCKTIPGGPRMSGFAFALRGSAGVRADESLAWWYGDNDIDWQARKLGGTVSVGGLTVQHLYPNSTTVGDLAEQAGRDREVFVAKWGMPPW